MLSTTTEHRGARSSRVSFHPGAVLLTEKECPELWLCPVGEAPGYGLSGQSLALLGTTSPGSLLAKLLALSLDNTVCLLNLPLYLGVAVGSGYILLPLFQSPGLCKKKESGRKGRKLDPTFQKIKLIKSKRKEKKK